MTTGAYRRQGAEFLVNTTTTGAQADAALTALAGGGFVITWTDNSGSDGSGAAVRGQRYDALGVRIGAEFLVNTTTANAQQQPAVTALASGGFAVSWTDFSLQGDTDSAGIKTRIYDAAGVAVGAEFLSNTQTVRGQTNVSMTGLASGGFVQTWTDASGIGVDNKGAGIKGQVFNAGGGKVGGEFLVNTTITNSQQFSSTASLVSGGFVVTWTDSSLQGGDASASGIKGQVFSATGTKVGAEFLVNTATAAAQDQAQVATLTTGGFVVTWRDLSLQGDTAGAGVKAQMFDGNGQRVGGEILVNGIFLNAQDSPSVIGIAGGGFAIGWRDNSILTGDPSGFGIKVQAFDAAGAKLGSEFFANTTTQGDQQQPKLTALASGALVVSWTDGSLIGGDASGTGIKAQIFAPSTEPITDITLSSTTLAETSVQGLPVATLGANGALNASYTYQLVDDSTGGAFGIVGDRLVVADSAKLDFETASTAEITIRAIDSFGNSFDEIIDLQITEVAIEARYAGGADMLANTATLNNQQAAMVASLPSGGYVAVWTDNSGQGGDASGNGIKGQVHDASGARVGSEFLVNTTTLNSQDNASVVSLASGGFVVSWADNSGGSNAGYEIRAQRYNADGSRAGGEIAVNTATAGSQTAPVVTSLASGGFMVAWTDGSGQGGDSSGTGIKARIFDAAGLAAGGEFLVNTATATAQDTVAATTLESGNVVVTWRDSSGVGGDASRDAIKAQMFDANGAKVGGETLVNTETASNQQTPAIDALTSGGYVIAWADASNRGGDADNYAIKAQVFDAAGNKFGAEVLVNTTTAGAQLQPTVTALSFGGFVIGWADYSGTNSEQGTAGIKAQMFDGFGSKVGGEVSVNTETLGAQAEPTVTDLPGGGFAVGWTDYSGQGGDATGTSVKTKLFAPLPGQGAPPNIITGTDTLAATEDQPAQFLAAGLLANDRAASNTAMTVTGVTAVSGGSVVLNIDGTIDFVPTADFTGRASFNYSVIDAEGFTATGRANINVANVNDAPIGVADQVGVGQDGGTITATALLANDANVDPGDILTITAVSATATGAALTLAGNTITYAPGAAFLALGVGQAATDSFSYVVADSAGLTSTATVTITIAGRNDAPTGLALTASPVDENAPGGTVVGALAAADPDNGDTLSYALTDSAGGRFAVDAVTGVVTVANGSLLDFETAAAHQIVARVTDANGLFVEAPFAIALKNLPEPRTYSGDNGGNIFTAPSDDLWTINGLGGNDTLNGNASADTIFGGAGSDAIDGRGGADAMYGGTGNDTFFVDDIGDATVEYFGEGVDIVFAGVDFTLAINIENLTQTGSADIAAIGNDFNNTINGNAGSNMLDGGAGRDLLVGNAGDDMLVGNVGADWLQGGDGADTLIGGAGGDELTGGAGADTFVFDQPATPVEVDIVKDFGPGIDKLAFSKAVFAAFAADPLGTLAPGAFVVGSAATTADQHIVYNPGTGGLFYDSDGVGGAAAVQVATMGRNLALTANDIILIA
ncbi:beta strand repeat-containing protein [Sandarakinorhabdus sp. DWP1-3-1]|uniref:beta strand repeat-containing protein n=1 Tax=Sandarakinorhabdus sp. DWP1-3-1 TaxID=2804627 RepID=UPI003CEA1A99